MKKKILFICLMVSLLFVLFALGVSAQSTNEFASTPETISGIDLTDMNTDTTARVVMVDKNGVYHTYPAQYIVSSNTKFAYNFKPINDALKDLGISYSKNSVVRIEVPDNITIAANCGDLCSCAELKEIKFSPNSQLTKLEYGCFYNNKKLEKLNIPKNVTTIETLIINYSTLKELIFDDGFSAVLPKDSFKGAEGVEKVVFSNQMTTVEDRALDSTLGTSLKEFYFGASLQNLGTNNMAWVKQSVKFYIQGDFLKDAESITMETFSWWASSACLPTGVIFFTGTRSQAQALMDKSTYDRVFAPNSTLVEWDASKTDDEYVPASGWTIVYDYNKCKAFYNNEHNISSPEYKFTSYVKNACIESFCINCNSTQQGETFAPIISFLGFSAKMDSTAVTVGYHLNNDSLEKYLSEGNSFNYGVVGYIPDGTSCKPLQVGANGVEAVDAAYTIQAEISGIYSSVDFVIKGFPDEAISLTMCMYVYDGNSIVYLCGTKGENKEAGTPSDVEQLESAYAVTVNITDGTIIKAE